MKSRIQKWGNSLALRIPKSFAIEAGLCEASGHTPTSIEAAGAIRHQDVCHQGFIPLPTIRLPRNTFGLLGSDS